MLPRERERENNTLLVYRTTLHTYMYEIAHNIHTFLFLNACVKVFTPVCTCTIRTTFTTHKFPTGNSPKFDEFSVEWICLLSIKMYKNSPKTKREMVLRTCLFCFLCFLFLLFQRHVSNTCPFQKCKSFSFFFSPRNLCSH